MAKVFIPPGMRVGRTFYSALSLAALASVLAAQTTPMDHVAEAALHAPAAPETGAAATPAPAGVAAGSPESGSTVVVVRPAHQRAHGWTGKLGAGLESPQLYHASQWALLEASTFDETMTAEGLSHPSRLQLTVVNAGLTRTVDLDFSNRFREGGWARVASARNATTVVAVYATADALMAVAARRLARQGGRWRALASVGMLAESVVHFSGAMSWAGLPNRLSAPYAGFNPVWVP